MFPEAFTHNTYSICAMPRRTTMGTSRDTTDGLDYAIEDTDLNFLKEGDRLRVVRKNGRVEVLYATADMDGHSVSTQYGKAAGTDYFDDPIRCYLNVKFDHIEYSGHWRRPNDTIKAAGPFRVHVNAAVRDRIKSAKTDASMLAKKSELAEKLKKAEEMVAAVRREMVELGI